MNEHPEPRHRRSLRLRSFDYSQPGAYFVTIVAHDRACLFGEVVAGEMRLNECGEIVRSCWNDLPRHYPNVELDSFCVMPNHVHGIVVLHPLLVSNPPPRVPNPPPRVSIPL